MNYLTWEGRGEREKMRYKNRLTFLLLSYPTLHSLGAAIRHGMDIIQIVPGIGKKGVFLFGPILNPHNRQKTRTFKFSELILR